MRTLLLIVVAATLTHCAGCLRDADMDSVMHGAAIGDSNTADTGNGSWFYAAQADLTHGNVLYGTMVKDEPAVWLNYSYPTFQACGTGGQTLLDSALAIHADVFLLLLGTNDLRVGRTPSETLACLNALAAQAPSGTTVFYALIPPLFSGEVAASQVPILNDMIRATVPAKRVIDLFTGFTASDFYPDGLHRNPTGQAKVAQLVTAALRAY